ncbi:hypothetical protein DdX_13157 [Ditylenchus destructor]|uniref:Uncharacterized protein n=1 Tax=Ditylenchus destructor TaxID=166010 RepID=A0AAD4R2T5_9BILA|nr:hypothetical protein DdX_13157 [Ditylenchus destructor]
MIDISKVHYVNCEICAILGTFFNSLLIWMIVYRSVAEIRPYSRILLQTCDIEIYTIIVMIIAQPAILPCVSSLVSIVAVLISALVGKASSVYLHAFIIVPLHWIPVINPVITIVVVGSYRRVVFRSIMQKRTTTVKVNIATVRTAMNEINAPA